MPRYRRWYRMQSEFEASSYSTKQEKIDDGRTVIVARVAATPRTSICSITNPTLVALDTPELRRRCYHCYCPESEPLAVDAEDEAKCFTMCQDCETVRFCSQVSIAHRGKTDASLLTLSIGVYTCRQRVSQSRVQNLPGLVT